MTSGWMLNGSISGGGPSYAVTRGGVDESCDLLSDTSMHGVSRPPEQPHRISSIHCTRCLAPEPRLHWLTLGGGGVDGVAMQGVWRPLAVYTGPPSLMPPRLVE